jgi:hypothetical protein
MLLVEGGLAMGTSLLGALLPGLVAAALGYVLFIGLGDWGGLDAASLSVPGLPNYVGTHVLDLGLAVVVGVVAAGALFAIRRLAERITKLDAGMPALLLAGAMLPVIAFDVSPTWAVAAGCAAGMAAGTRLLFAPILLGALLVGHTGLDAIPAAVLASAAAWLTVTTLDRRWGGHEQ